MQQLVKNFRTGPFECEAAESYDSGLKKLLSGKYAVCLLDYRLGRRDGLELLHEARIAQCETPIIFLTADDNEDIDIAAMEAGAADYLVKGELKPRLLERSIRYALKLGDTMRQLRQMALHDELTGVFNRRELHRLLSEEWHRGSRFLHPFALVLTDIDHFKRINDEYGHPVGDKVLCHVAQLLTGQVRLVDRLARFGGEEFAIIMPETGRQEAMSFVERLRVLLEETPYILPDSSQAINVTISAGLAMSPHDATNPDELIAAADKALYDAKKAGRNRVCSAG
jgi:diguanylate cyclase (GGDEF)-like protein